MNSIKVSVIVPVYNVEEYLEECLVSLERQTLKDIEVIIVNDGSTDNSKEIAEKFLTNNNFTLIEQKNGGLSAARNTGMNAAKGEYIYFLDSDDFLSDNALEKLYTLSKKNNLDVVKFAAYTFEDHSVDYKWQKKNGYKYSGKYVGIYNGIDIYKRFIKNGDIYPSCCLIFTKRKMIEDNGLRFCEGIIHEDNLFHFEIMTLSSRVSVLNEPLYYRRYRSGSITQIQNWMEKNKSLCVIIEKMDEFIEEHQQIKGNVSEWQIMALVNTMLYNWGQMAKKAQYSFESKKCFKRIKPMVKKYGKGKNKSLKVFYISMTIYKLYISLGHMKKRIFKLKNGKKG